MGNLIFTNDIISLTSNDISIPNLASGYSTSSILAYGSLARQIRTDSVAVDTELLTIDFGAQTEVSAIFLNDVNFDKITIMGHATDVWGSDGLGDGDELGDEDTFGDLPSFSSDFTISSDPVVGRYKIFCALTDFNYRYMQLYLPSDTSVTNSAAYFKLSSLVALSAADPLSVNIGYDYERGSSSPFHNTPFEYGGDERLSLGDDLKFMCSCKFSQRPIADETELWTLNRMSIADRLIMYENDGDTSRAYIVLRDDSYSGTIITHGFITGSSMRFKEQI